MGFIGTNVVYLILVLYWEADEVLSVDVVSRVRHRGLGLRPSLSAFGTMSPT